MSTDAKMQLLGYSPEDEPIYYAEPGVFEAPGIYVWNGEENELVTALTAEVGKYPQSGEGA